MSGRKEAVTIFLITAVVCAAADLVSKELVARWVIAKQGEVVLIPGWLDFIYRINPGGMWSFGASLGVMNLVLASLSGVVATAILLWGCLGLRGGQIGSAIVFGMILGGAVGNLYDRLHQFEGFDYRGVRDFIHVHYHDVYHYPTFNLADSFLVCGVAYLVLTSFFAKEPAEQATESADNEKAA